ncbi:MAG TPA: cysteine--tRNA ligase [Candidatus Dormibacteraeota bacterium]|nr:cysteine--tRNA ligase [Candidatus Dormibacteraeota bacterium]
MPIRLFNSLTQALEVLQPLHPGQVTMYTCGPTVHDRAHIGNFRSYLAEDLLRRHLEARGLKVEQVMNITDVDDKIIAKATALGETLAEFTTPFEEAFFLDLDRLRIEPAAHYPRATEYLGPMLALVERLVATGHAYQSEGSVYFRLDSFPNYGRLSRLDVQGLSTGASGRVDADEYEAKEAVRDFALWKAGKEGDLAAWPSPFGWGRPGWHIECSAMAMELLGESIDIHCGGVDNKFPHHENEIAQSESATGQPFVRLWFHVEHLVVKGGKMAKSEGNFVTLATLLERGHSPLAVRYHLLGNTHYRQRLHFQEEDLVGASDALDRLATFWRRCAAAHGGELKTAGSGDPLTVAAQRAQDRFEAAMDDDLNLPLALGSLHDLVREGNRLLDEGRAGGDGCGAALLTLRTADSRLAVIERAAVSEDATLTTEEQQALARREDARSKGNFSKADRIRDQLLELGIVVEDTKEGTRWHRL